jgi:hypothetical protein
MWIEKQNKLNTNQIFIPINTKNIAATILQISISTS